MNITIRDLPLLPLGLIVAPVIAGAAMVWSSTMIRADLDRINEANARLAPVARFAITGNDGVNPIETDRESGCQYRVIYNGLAGYRRMEILRSNGSPDCDASRIIPGLAEKRAAVQYQLQAEGLLSE